MIKIDRKIIEMVVHNKEKPKMTHVLHFIV